MLYKQSRMFCQKIQDISTLNKKHKKYKKKHKIRKKMSNKFVLENVSHKTLRNKYFMVPIR